VVPVTGSDLLEVTSASGRVRGRRQADVASFKGIPYAAAPIGPLRFKAPQPVTPWRGVRDALRFGPQSLQTSADLGLMGAGEVVGLLFEPPERIENSEDCLYLNVWTPDICGARPVMVWCHSGGFFFGSGATPHCDGTRLARNEDVVVVTLNHRLGLLGFLHLEGLAGAPYAGSGNAGLLDIVAALRWVRENIGAFGGDPENVTIFGQSGGGAKVNSLMAMPCARGLFHRAIIQSGAWRRFREPDDAIEVAMRVLEHLGVSRTNASRLSDLPAEGLMAAQHEVMKALIARPQAADGSLADRHLGPVRDGNFLPYHPFSEEGVLNASDITLMLGTTRDEGTFFLSADPGLVTLDLLGLEARVAMLVGDRAQALIEAYRQAEPATTPRELMIEIVTDHIVRIPAQRQAERRASLGAAPTYLYIFCFSTDVLDGRLCATHGLDIPFVFDNAADDPLAGSTAARHEMARAASSAWAAFARSGVPTLAQGPDWLPYELERRPVMLLDRPCRLALDPEPQRRRIWERLPFSQ
jgi:para-nitrobenzyl esterase